MRTTEGRSQGKEAAGATPSQRALHAIPGLYTCVCSFIPFIRGSSNTNRAELQEDSFDMMCRVDWVRGRLQRRPLVCRGRHPDERQGVSE